MKEYHIEIIESEGRYIARHIEYDQYGDGDTPEEALIDLAKVLQDLKGIFNR
jgi:hypothetical protein